MEDSVIDGCSALGGGGGLYLWHSYAEVHGTNITSSSSVDGGGVLVDGAANGHLLIPEALCPAGPLRHPLPTAAAPAPPPAPSHTSSQAVPRRQTARRARSAAKSLRFSSTRRA